MKKKALLALIIAVFFSGAVFAQADFGAMPKNTITVDIGPTILGAAFGIAGDIIGEEGLSSSGFGIGAQYERQLSERLSVAGRFAFMRLGMGLTFDDDYVSTNKFGSFIVCYRRSRPLFSHGAHFLFGRNAGLCKSGNSRIRFPFSRCRWSWQLNGRDSQLQREQRLL